MTLDVAITAVDGQSRMSDDAADRPFNARYDQRMAKYHRLADQNGLFHFVPAVFSHTDRMHESIKRLITEQIRHNLILSEGEATQSRLKLTMRWWKKCVSVSYNTINMGTEAVIAPSVSLQLQGQINSRCSCSNIQFVHLITSKPPS